MLGNADVRISYVGRRLSRRRCTATRSATSASTSRPARATVETVFGALDGRPGRLRDPAAGDHAPLGARPATSRCARTAIEANSHIAPPQALPVEVRPAARARAVLRARPARAGRAAAGRGHRRRGLRQAPRRRARAGWPARVHVDAGRTRSTSSAGTAACTRTRSTSPTSSRSPAGCTSRRRCTRCSRATTSSSATSCRARSTTTRCDPGAVLPLERRLRRGHVLLSAATTRRARAPASARARSRCTRAGTRTARSPARSSAASGAEFFDELAVMVDTFRPLALGEAGTRVATTGRTPGPGRAGARRRDLARPPDGTGFGLDNLPYGVFSTPGTRAAHRRARSATACSTSPASPGTPVHATGSLNAFLARGPRAWARAARPADRLAHRRPAPPRGRAAPGAALGDVTLHLPIEVADYVDFYSSEQHAANVGRIFRPGSRRRCRRTGSTCRSATTAAPARSSSPARRSRRPRGQRARPDGRPGVRPVDRGWTSRPSSGFVVGAPSEPGEPVPVGGFADHVFGVCLRQRLVRPRPAGLGVRAARARSSASRSSRRSRRGWCRWPRWRPPACRPPARDPQPLPYLRDDDAPVGPRPHPRGPAQRADWSAGRRSPDMYWTAAQQLAHLTVNGASLRTGDLFASGTVSGPGARPARLAARAVAGAARSR